MRKKDLIQLGITGGLVVVLVLALGNASKKERLRNLKKVSLKTIDLPETADNFVKSSLQSNDLYVVLEQQAKSLELRRDPFTAAPILSANSLQSGVNLTGILWDKDKPLAIIDGEVVKKGERIGPKTVVEIKRDRVILSDGQVFTELKLEQ